MAGLGQLDSRCCPYTAAASSNDGDGPVTVFHFAATSAVMFHARELVAAGMSHTDVASPRLTRRNSMMILMTAREHGTAPRPCGC